MKRLVQVVADSLLIIVAFVLSMALRLDSFAFANNSEVWLVLIPVLPVTIGAFIKLGHYRAVVRFVSTKAVRIVAAGAVISSLALFFTSQIFNLLVFFRNLFIHCNRGSNNP